RPRACRSDMPRRVPRCDTLLRSDREQTVSFSWTNFCVSQAQSSVNKLGQLQDSGTVCVAMRLPDRAWLSPGQPPPLFGAYTPAIVCKVAIRSATLGRGNRGNPMQGPGELGVKHGPPYFTCIVCLNQPNAAVAPDSALCHNTSCYATRKQEENTRAGPVDDPLLLLDLLRAVPRWRVPCRRSVSNAGSLARCRGRRSAAGSSEEQRQPILLC